MTGTDSHTLDVPGAVLHYDLHPAQPAAAAQPGTPPYGAPALLMIGSPMTAAGFTSLAARFPDRTVVTYDPRGVGRSTRTDPSAETTPERHADDLHRIISALGAGPVDIFASSGGAVNALVLVARHPEQVRVLVAHEPPSVPVLPDSEPAHAAVLDVQRTYQRDGFGAAMVKFMALSSWQGEVPADFADRPTPDPTSFGLPADDGSRDDALFAGNLVSCTQQRPDFDALRAASTRVVLAAGVESAGQLAARAAAAIAERLGTGAVEFPSNHGGFLGGEFGMHGDPDGFAATLREVLAGRS
ncbi:alpha/beta fold hydrolase [Plantactinospora sp. KBS50]|uniref:alpha/beta fold hydrolase n=1 Tax=Plantactinospora sp. KBS50 TaxID=2024580 RepID=UPI000BAAF4B9|nr:alpha/beta hydrolase [Plantactinospora sp. KBS50]ASW53061.1 alpha/beta hydrolase [Plantactinospora sp. KBS50]